MSVMLQSLNNIRTLRAMAREFSIDVLEEMLEKFRVVTKERREEEEQQQRELAERQEKISTWLELMKADGINPEELLGNNSAAAHALVKNASRVRRNINSPMLTVKLKPGPVRAVHRSQSLRRWQKVNLSTIS